jgi:biopolymer transport protein ExbD
MVNIQNLESELLSLFQNETVSSIVLRAEKSVPVDYVVKVMDIANRNKFKIILAVNPS